MTGPATSPLSRRIFLGGVAASAAAALLAACGGETAAPTAVPAASSAAPAAPSVAPAATVAPTGAAAVAPTTVRATASVAAGGVATATRAAGGATPATGALVGAPVTPRTAAPRGELRYAVGISFPTTVDATKGAYNIVTYAMGETLTRLTPENKLEAWLAESVAQINDTTWRVKLRANIRFWDNTAADATAVAASFRTNWETQGAATGLIDKATTITVVDPLTLDFVLPRPTGNFPYALSAQYFVVHKDTGKTMTGAYRPTKFEANNELTLEAFTGHWGGPPPIAKITVRSVPDANTRTLALQSGEVDMINSVLPETLGTLGPDIEAISIPSTRVHLVLLNPTRAPFADQQLREATAYAIDRNALLQIALGGQGAALATIFPTSSGFDQVPLQTYDQAKAKQLLDAAGWVAGADGVRAKEGKRLAFTLLSYPGRPELTQMAVAMQAQLKAVGYDMQVREVAQIDPELQKTDYDASMYSVNTLITGDPLYLYGLLLGNTSTYNYVKYALPGIEPLLAQLRDEPDTAKRQAISKQIQDLVRTYVPDLFLAAPPLIVAYKKGKLLDFTLHPNDLYLINTMMRVS